MKTTSKINWTTYIYIVSILIPEGRGLKKEEKRVEITHVLDFWTFYKLYSHIIYSIGV